MGALEGLVMVDRTIVEMFVNWSREIPALLLIN